MTLHHLLPSLQTIAELPAEERINKIRQDHWIGYTHAEQALTQLSDLLKNAKRRYMPNLLILGSTNNGKTTIVEKFRRQHVPYESIDQSHEIIPVLLIQMPSDPTIKRFYMAITEALGSPITRYRSLANHAFMILKLLRKTQTKVLIIDEIHNLLAGNPPKQREFLNTLRMLRKALPLSIVGVGLKEVELLICSDDPLENQFVPLVLPLWRDDHEFMRLLANFQRILPLQRPSNLMDDTIRSFILNRTEGILGEIVALLTKATRDAIRSEKEYIDFTILEQTDYQAPTVRCRLYEGVRD